MKRDTWIRFSGELGGWQWSVMEGAKCIVDGCTPTQFEAIDAAAAHMGDRSPLQSMQVESRRLGVKWGEDAASFQRRDPKAALKLALFVKLNQDKLTRSIASAL